MGFAGASARAAAQAAGSRTSRLSRIGQDGDVSDFRIVVLASGGGTNLQAILDQLHGGDEGIELVGVGSDKQGATALERARKAGVETAVFQTAEYGDRE